MIMVIHKELLLNTLNNNVYKMNKKYQEKSLDQYSFQIRIDIQGFLFICFDRIL